MISICPIDSLNVESSFLSQRGDISCDGIENALAVITSPKLRYQTLTLNLPYQAIG